MEESGEGPKERRRDQRGDGVRLENVVEEVETWEAELVGEKF